MLQISYLYISVDAKPRQCVKERQQFIKIVNVYHRAGCMVDNEGLGRFRTRPRCPTGPGFRTQLKRQSFSLLNFIHISNDLSSIYFRIYNFCTMKILSSLLINCKIYLYKYTVTWLMKYWKHMLKVKKV